MIRIHSHAPKFTRTSNPSHLYMKSCKYITTINHWDRQVWKEYIVTISQRYENCKIAVSNFKRHSSVSWNTVYTAYHNGIRHLTCLVSAAIRQLCETIRGRESVAGDYTKSHRWKFRHSTCNTGRSNTTRCRGAVARNIIYNLWQCRVNIMYGGCRNVIVSTYVNAASNNAW